MYIILDLSLGSFAVYTPYTHTPFPTRHPYSLTINKHYPLILSFITVLLLLYYTMPHGQTKLIWLFFQIDTYFSMSFKRRR